MSEVFKQLSEYSPLFLWFSLAIVSVPILKLCISYSSDTHTIRLKNLELLLSASKNPTPTPCEKYVIESLLSSIYKRDFTFPIIQALYGSNSPLKSFTLYCYVFQYLKFTKCQKRPFQLKKKYKPIKLFGYRFGYWVSLRELLYYSVCSFLALIMFVYAIKILTSSELNSAMIIVQLLILISFGSLLLLVAWNFLKQFGKIEKVAAFLRFQLTKKEGNS